MLFAQVLSILGFASYPSALPIIQAEWQLSNLESGFLASCFFIGYVLMVPLATTLTDRIDTRQIYLSGGILGFTGLFGMGYLSQHFLDACVYLIVHGAGIAGMYMPGLKIIADRIKVGEVTRHISFYTAFFGIGAASSYLSSGLLIDAWGWRIAFMCTALGPLLGGLLAWLGTQRLAHEKTWWQIHFDIRDAFPWARWQRVMQVKEAMAYMLGYAAHSIELFASRSWLVAFFTFAIVSAPGGSEFPLTATVIATLINLIGVPASILGNEMALRLGRHRWIYIVMTGSIVSGLMLGASVGAHWTWLIALGLLHSIFIMADSATLTAGLVISVPEEIKGTAMGLHSVMGFGAGLLGPAIFGAALDLSRAWGHDGWFAAYSSIVIWSLFFMIYTKYVLWKNSRAYA
jgi:MFS family permease